MGEITRYEAVELMAKERAREVMQLLPGTFADPKAKGEAVAKFCRQLMTACEKNPALLDADMGSLWLAALNLAATGLDVSGVTGEAALVPYKGRVTPMIMARGYIVLAMRSGGARAIEHNVVCERDVFDYEFGSAPYLRHKPALSQRGKPLAVWAIATLPTGEQVYEVMGWDEVEAIRSRSKASQNGPWATDPLEMGRKTVLRRIIKRVPFNSTDMMATLVNVQSAEDADFGIETEARREIAHTAPATLSVSVAGSGMAALKERTGMKAPPAEPAPASATEKPAGEAEPARAPSAPAAPPAGHAACPRCKRVQDPATIDRRQGNCAHCFDKPVG